MVVCKYYEVLVADEKSIIEPILMFVYCLFNC